MRLGAHNDDMSSFLQVVQEAIKKSDKTHMEIAKEAGIDRARVTEIANKKELRGTQNLEKILNVIHPNALEEFRKLCKNEG